MLSTLFFLSLSAGEWGNVFCKHAPLFPLLCLENKPFGGKRGGNTTTLFLQRFSAPPAFQTCRTFTPFAPKLTFFLVLQGKFRGHHLLQSSPALLPSASSASAKQSCFFLFFLCFCVFVTLLIFPPSISQQLCCCNIYLPKTNKSPRKLYQPSC